MASRGDICFVDGKLVSVADDSVLKVFSIKNSVLRQESHIELSGFEKEPLTVCSNQVDKLIIGGKGKTVNVYSLSEDKKVTKNVFEKPSLALKLQSDVTKTNFNGTKWVLGFSSEAHLSLFNTQTENTIFCKPGHEGCSVKSGAVDPTGRFVASTGSDGFMNIYELSENQDSATFLTKEKISNRRVPADRTFDL